MGNRTGGTARNRKWPIKLAFKAKADFKSIYKYTFREFGKKQAEKYTGSLEQCFLLLGKTPTMGRKVDYIKKGVFRHEHGRHVVFYRVKKDHIFIVRLLHEHMDPARHL